MKRVHKQLNESSYSINNETIDVFSSVGIANVLQTDESISEVIGRADSALYHVKINGRNNVALFNDVN